MILWVCLATELVSSQHLGGIHSGCAVSAIIWLLYRVVLNFLALSTTHKAVVVMGVVTLFTIMVSALSAFPWIRNTHHKYVSISSKESRDD